MPGLGDTIVSRTGLEFLALKELVAFLSFAYTQKCVLLQMILPVLKCPLPSPI